MWIIFSGVLIHLMFLSSIFDIYFTSPLIHGMTPFKSDTEPPAKRLVLIVSDGLRAETLYGTNYTKINQMRDVAPYLSSVVETVGCWGTSHTRVPTESRPGHVALVAGIYEDPSAVAKGWKENPVDFDTVFNESRYTWSWGSPDILPMFTKVSGKHVFAQSYSAEEEDFSGKESTALLDKWVFDHFEQFLSSALKDEQLSEQIESDRVIFFLHLLGMDTAGHTHKPYSKEHIHNMKVVDDGVREVNDLVNNYYQDNNTVFVFTADHGMTDWGSHGAGSQFETETPFIAWGAGIKRSVNPIQLNQADIAPLISTLIGIPIPVNSVGILPTELLNLPENKISSGMHANARQIHEQFKEKQQRTKANSFRIFYYEFSDLNTDKIKALEDSIQLSIRNKEHTVTIKLCRELIELSLRGLDYYQNYYQRLLLGCIVLSYVGWIVLLLLTLGDYPSKKRFFMAKENEIDYNNSYGNKNINMTVAACLVFTFCCLFFQSLPNMYYLYCAAPQCIFWAICHKFRRCYNRIKEELRSRKLILNALFHCVVYLIGIEILVWCFFNRAILSISLCMMSVWPSMKQSLTIGYKLWWCLSCVSLAVFPLMPVVGTSFDLSLVAKGVLIWIACAVVSCFLPIFRKEKRYILVTCVQILLLIVVLCNLIFIDSAFGDKQGLTSISQIISWLLLGISLVLPLFGSNRIQSRLMTIMLSFIIPFISLSVSHEPMFMLNLFANLMAWMYIELKYDRYYLMQCGRALRTTDPRRYVNLADFRRAFFFLQYSILAFFGLGNIASLNSFDPMWVRCYLTVFSPFTMAALILFKTLIPYLAVSCVFRSIVVNIGAFVRDIFIIVLIYCDIAGAHFLFMVQNTGSWLDIGSSISHFVIMQIIVLFLMLLYGVSSVLTDFNSDRIYRVLKRKLG